MHHRFPGCFAGLAILSALARVSADDLQLGDVAQGKVLFQQTCAVCHADALGPGNVEIAKQGPSLIAVLGRHAASYPGFPYSKALAASGLTWDSGTLDRFLSNPSGMVPGTTMPVAVAKPEDRQNLIAYLATLKYPDHYVPVPVKEAAADGNDAGDWRHAGAGTMHHLTLADLPPPFKTKSSGNHPHVVAQPAGASLTVPPGFKVQQFASGLNNPRVMRIAPNGDIFLSETGARRVRVLRAADGADAPTENQIFADGLDRPFGIAFYPPGNNPEWVYVANNNSVVRFAYHNGDLKATGQAEVVVPHLTDSGGGHTTRDVAFSLDGRHMFISVGSGSNVAEGMKKKTTEEIESWETEHGKGAAWDGETNRADILVTDPEGKEPIHPYATGIRNGVGLAVNPDTGDLWTSTNERDGLGDDLVPDYITRVKEGGFYGWPWYYLGNHEDPRHKNERPDLADLALVPDVMVQSHSASLEMCFYPANKGVAAFPSDYAGDIFAAFHGSWNRSQRTGYEVVRVHLDHGVPTGEYEDFMTGFVIDNHNVWGRPVGVAVTHDGALLVSEDGNGTIWRITPSGVSPGAH